MQITNFHLLTFLIFLILSLGGVLLFIYFYKRRETLKRKYYLLFEQHSYFYAKYIFLLISFVTILFSVFGIKYGNISSKTAIQGIDIVFVLDVSKSMNVVDIGPRVSRLTLAKESIASFISDNRENRYGLIIFAGDAVSSSPLTSDIDAFLNIIKNVDYQNLTIQGTNFLSALDLGVERFRVSDNERAKGLILISDGGDNDDIQNNSIKKIFQDKNISSLILGVGTENGGKIPNGVDFFGTMVYQTYQGQEIITKLNVSNLQQLARSMGGEYGEIKTINDLKQINKTFSNLEKNSIEIAIGEKRQDFNRILSLISFFFFVLYLITYYIRPFRTFL